ncbi:HK97 family phage prohead protease [Cryobacterium sp. Y62]|uniref:HK97 family phage prohead protease n=1 Tax=Cryobacterium sp. Y62 TaxID=2048284 RepID=UPI000CE3CCD2|nr:HK97 family phage prohead protease [Cryobacterium sp. Y62]
MTDAPIHFMAYGTNITLSAETRTISGTITVFDVPTNDYRRLILHEGALRPRLPISRVKMLRDHDPRDPVGYMASLSADTSQAVFKVATGKSGDRALFEAHPDQKLRDGLSVGIQVLSEPGAYLYDPETGEYHVYAAELLEVSLCAIPAYSDAVRASYAAPTTIYNLTTPAPAPTTKEITMDPETLAALTLQLDAHTADLDRTVETRLTAFTAAGTVATGQQYLTYGDFVKAYVSGVQEARDFSLAYAGSTSADDYTRNVWLADAIRLVEKTRKIVNTFTREPLPDTGMTLEYAKLASNTTQVGKQAAQGNTLLTGKIALTSASTDVDTYGGYTSVPRQIIDRANPAYLTTTFRAMLIEYARATEAAVRAIFDATVTAAVAAENTVTLAAAATAYDWLDLIIDASETFETRGYELAGTLVSKDVFKRLVRLEDTSGNSLMRVYGQGVNQTGEIDVTALDGTLANVKFKLLAGAAANTAAFYNPLALTTWETASPTQLENGNASNLTHDYSVYGYLASASQFPDALLAIDFATAV